MKKEQLISQLKNDKYRDILEDLYGEKVYESQKERYIKLIERFVSLFGDENLRMVSSPGRTELGGNHTDHNLGKVLAASIQLDSLAVVSPSADGMVSLWSEGFPDLFSVDTGALERKEKNESGTTALIRGVLSVFKSRGLAIGGFNACISSDVLVGSGLSSSASLEVLLGKILGLLYNNDSVGAVDLALIGQKAENEYLNKPCGLMDQVACAYGGIVAIDFADPGKPEVESIHYSFEENGYKLLVIDTGGDHVDLTDDYAAIPLEMKMIAEAFGEEVCRNVDDREFREKIPVLSARYGDRAVLRALHFFEENKRVDSMLSSLKRNEMGSFLKDVRCSGNSSFKFLQNVYSNKSVSSQKMSLAIGLAEVFDNFDGAVRVHGGGFAGTVQVYIKKELFSQFRQYIEPFFGPRSVTPLRIRQKGAVEVFQK